uniref:Methyltransferase small domain-containing protein n=1 Tax=Chromera velia CCMP2878 TaxID=1169474 RepID=A0A0G4G1W3_9ALVE|eukprot:Cvel_19831.t1-p1 / transcript=Cvel_19831.t1 / gene=Cvel_19831 / organism=Chromera_velia_CCMP2878 / gene_product=hypothetical protein / transcript_product=hypothetical protein / location=Cvel_scaffold1736:10062-11075(+) / protein_length=338 / sequence_SO=supercontig / SO=protein_coding / is_pseudo=false
MSSRRAFRASVAGAPATFAGFAAALFSVSQGEGDGSREGGWLKGKRFWKQTAVNVSLRPPFSAEPRTKTFFIRQQKRPPPIGTVLWPAGRVLLQWFLHRDVIRGADFVVEIGAGCGLTAIGLAAFADSEKFTIVATDSCAASLENLRFNIAENAVGDRVNVCEWEIGSANGGRRGDCSPDSDGTRTQRCRFPVDVKRMQHVIGADVVYHGAEGVALAETIACVLSENPEVEFHLLLVDRFSGGAVAGLSGVAGAPQAVTSFDVDPAIRDFETAAARLGLRVEREEIGGDVREAVQKTQTIVERGRWWAAGFWDGFVLYHVTKGSSLQEGRDQHAVEKT